MKQLARVAAKPFAAFILTTATLLLAACGDYPNENAAAVVQVTTVIPNSGQIMANNPVVSPVNANTSDDGIGFLNQALGYSGPNLKMPLPAGYNWRLNTKVGDLNDWGHQGKHYYSLDFGRSIQDNNGAQTAFGEGVVDVLAAAGGTLKNVIDTCDQGNPDCNGALPTGRTACSIEIDHGNGFTTKYLHFKMGTVAFKKEDEGKGLWVPQGQFLGKMGNTGNSCGTAHVHFQVLHNGDSSKDNQNLTGVTLEGKQFIDYQVGIYYPSTNGFTYMLKQPYGANPRVCKDALLIDPWTLDYTCIQQSAFNLYRRVYSDALIRSIQSDVCLRAEVSVAGVKVYDVPEYCSNGIRPGSRLYYNNTNYFTNAAGSGQVKYYAHAKGREYLPAPFATVSFTVLNSNTPSNQPAPVNNLPAHQSAVKGPNPAFAWTDAQGWPVSDHDLYFWYWNGSSWSGLGWVFGWPYSNVIISGLPTSRYILWMVRSCNNNGCSRWSNQTYFYLQP